MPLVSLLFLQKSKVFFNFWSSIFAYSILQFPGLQTNISSFQQKSQPSIAIIKPYHTLSSCIKGKDACYWENRSWEYIVTFRATFHLFFISPLSSSYQLMGKFLQKNIYAYNSPKPTCWFFAILKVLFVHSPPSQWMQTTAYLKTFTPSFIVSQALNNSAPQSIYGKKKALTAGCQCQFFTGFSECHFVGMNVSVIKYSPCS